MKGSVPVSGGPNPMTEYIYDAEGMRVSKGSITAWSSDTTVNGFTATNSYVLGPSNEQLSETNGQGQWKHTNVYAAGSMIATYDVTPGNVQALHFQLADWLDSRRVQTDYAGNTEESCSSLAFGDGLNCTQTGIATADDATEHHFTGEERDAESGLDYFRGSIADCELAASSKRYDCSRSCTFQNLTDVGGSSQNHKFY